MGHPQMILSPFCLEAPLPAARRLATPGWQVNAPAANGTDRQSRMTAVHRPLVAAVAEALRKGQQPVTIAGDCCSTIAVLAGLQSAGLDPVLVWLDAHGDFNTWETTPSGFIGGMPLAMLVGIGDQGLAQGVGLRTQRQSDVILADARDLDPGERQLLEASAVRRVTELAAIPALLPVGRPIYVHLDPDVIDPADVPAMHYPTPGGPSLAVVRSACASLARTGRVVAASLTLWDFDADEGRRTERACLSALDALLG